MHMQDKEYELRGKTIFEEFIRAPLPDAHCSWNYVGRSDIHLVFIQGPGRKRIELDISGEAFAQAVDDPESRPRLERAVKQQLGLSESGRGIGLVKEI